MAIDFSCPISGEQRDNNTVRFVAGFVLLISVVALLISILASTLISSILFAFNFLFEGSIVLVILILCAALESILSFCLGCWMYALFPRKLGNIMSHNFFKKNSAI